MGDRSIDGQTLSWKGTILAIASTQEEKNPCEQLELRQDSSNSSHVGSNTDMPISVLTDRSVVCHTPLLALGPVAGWPHPPPLRSELRT